MGVHLGKKICDLV